MRMIHRISRGITLLETMISLSIVGIVTIVVVIPGLVSGNDMSRRMMCQNNLRHWGQAVLALESAQGVYPSGGIHPWPSIEDYSSKGVPFQSDRQGLGWMYQALPYLQDPLPQSVTTGGVYKIESELFFCPARRGITRSSSSGTVLNDYAGMAAGPSRAQFREQYGDAGDGFFDSIISDARGCRSAFGFWGTNYYLNVHDPRPRAQLGHRYVGFAGVFVRSSYLVSRQGNIVDLDYDPLTTMKRIKDGTSRTGMITEKFVAASRRDGSGPGDDRGWSDGWDLDTMRLTFCSPISDDSLPIPPFPAVDLTPGSAHGSGLHVVMADGGVRYASFGIDLETWNRLGHRADGEFQPPDAAFATTKRRQR